MSELPDRPDLDQLRRQARELLRAAADGEPHALIKLQAVSERVTLSAAQLAVAREYGCPSWPVLRAEVERRRLPALGTSPASRGSDGQQRSLGAPEERWSFGGAAALETTEGALYSGALITGPGHAVLNAHLLPARDSQRPAARPGRLPAPVGRFIPGVLRRRPPPDQSPEFDDVTVVDDRGARYTLFFRERTTERPQPGPGRPADVAAPWAPSGSRAGNRLARAARAGRPGDPPPALRAPGCAGQPTGPCSTEPGREGAVGARSLAHRASARRRWRGP